MKYNFYTLTSSGGSVNIDGQMGEYTPLLVTAAAPVTLAAGFSIVDPYQQAGVPIIVRWDAQLNLGGFPVTITGQTISQDQLNQPGTFVSIYANSAYKVQYFPDYGSRPQDNPGVEQIVVLAAGGTRAISAGTDKSTVILKGAPTTLVGNYSLTLSTVGVTEGAVVRTIIDGDITLGSNTLSVDGLQISAYDALQGNVEVVSVFDGAAFRSVYLNANVPPGKLDVSGLGSADNGKLVNYNDSTKRFEPAHIRAENFSGSIIPLYKATVRIPTAEVLTLNATPKLIVPAPGAGRVIEVMAASFKIAYSSVPYATNTNLRLRHVGSPVILLGSTEILTSTVSRTLLPNQGTGSAGTTNQQITENTGIEAFVDVGNPTAGNSDVFVNIWYTITTY